MADSNLTIFTRGIIKDNPTFRMVLGICSTLAVSNRVSNSIAMALGTTFVLVASSFSISLLRSIIPRRVRMAVYTVIIATFVVCVDIFLKAFYTEISAQIGPYVGLIITNCIIMGRAESFASGNKPPQAILDALGVGMGYSLSLLLLASIREPLGFGTWLGITVLGDWWEPWVFMVMPPGAFFVLGLYIWVLRSIVPEEKKA